MIVQRTAPAAFTAEFENEQEVRDEHRTNLSFGALRLPTSERIALHAKVEVTLRGPGAGEIRVPATVVALLSDGVALAIEGNPDDILARLLSRRPEEETSEKNQNAWERMRGLSQMEKILLAVKADRSERALLLQDNDPRVLLSVLRNPRLTIEEVVRVAKSAFLNYQIVDVIMKTPQWMANLDVRLALMHNAKTPPPFSLRILPTLPDAEIRTIAKGGTNMALKQAALKLLQRKT